MKGGTNDKAMANDREAELHQIHCVAGLHPERKCWGERCFPAARREACKPGLLCNFYCGQPCRLEHPSSCPAGHLCRNDINGPSCVPSCLLQGCAEGRKCIQYDRELTVCAVVTGQDCIQSPCPAGQECRQALDELGDGARMWCATPCRAGGCPPGSTCFRGDCERPCDPNTPDACGVGQTCVYYPDERVAVCRIAG